MDVWLVRHDGAIVLQHNMPATPDPFLQAVATSRDGLVVSVEGLCPGYGRADVCAQAGMPFVWVHALSMNARRSGPAKNDPRDAHQIATLQRGSRLPQADVAPAARRAIRDLLRRRMPLRRQRADFVAQVHNTHRQDNVPELDQNIADKTTRAGVAERCAGQVQAEHV
jgi:hypothetical protein